MPTNVAFRAIAEFTYDWETWFGPEGEPRWINASVERITGWSAKACLAMPAYPLALVEVEDRPRIREALAGAREGTSGNDLEFRVLHRGGELRWGAMSWQPIASEAGEALGFRTSVRDITERKRVEERLRSAVERAQRAERAKTEFLANLSHELRTPVHNILGYSQLLRGSPLAEKQRTWVRVLAAEGESLLEIIDDLLALTAGRLAPSSLRLEEQDLGALVAGVAEAHRAALDKRGLALIVDVPAHPVPVPTDRRAITRLLRNLLDNARKYAGHGSVHVSLRVGREAALEVRDTGVGMAPEALAELRQPFARGDLRRARSEEGIGLGLSICEQLVAGLGGTLEIESSPGEGTCFRIELPLARAPQPVRMEIDERSPLPKSVLVVDDRATSRELARAFLEKLGCRVRTAEDTPSARACCREESFDVVLMDIHMPGMDGVEGAAWIRAEAHARGRPPVLVAMTADLFVSAADQSVFDAFLTKPIDAETLEHTLRSAARAVAHPEPEDAPLLDPARIRELSELHTADGESFLARFGRTALEDLRGLRAELRASRAAPSRLRTIHAIKGAAAAIGARSLLAQVRALEANGDPPTSAALETLEQHLDATLAALDARLRAHAPA